MNYLKKLGIGCAILVVLILGTSIGLFVWATRDTFWIDTVNRKDPGQVAYVFILSMMENKPIKPLVSPELWPQIDTWMAEHEPVQCSISDEGIFGSGHPENGKFVYSYSISTPCPDRQHDYFLSVENIILEVTTEGWQVTGWGEICETWNWKAECAN